MCTKVGFLFCILSGAALLVYDWKTALPLFQIGVVLILLGRVIDLRI